MHDDVKKVDQYPLCCTLTLHMISSNLQVLFHTPLDITSNGRYLSCRLSLTDNKAVRRCLLDLREVEYSDLTAFDILDTIDD